MIARSYLYVPANDFQMLERASTRGADALIIDLEDSVALGDKEQARDNLKSWLTNRDPDTQTWVRINSESIDEDLAAINLDKIHGLVVPKATIMTLEYVSKRLTGKCQLSALIESADSIFDAKRIASVSGVSFLQIGQLDLRAELGLSDEDDLDTFTYALSHCVLASAAAGINQPIAPIFRDFQNEQGLRESCQKLRRNGFFGRTCIHPKQIETINKEFTTSPETLSEAQEILDAVHKGQGAGLDSKGRMIDLASARLAQQIIDRSHSE